MTIHSLDVFLSQFWTSSLLHVQFELLLLDQHTASSGGDKVVWYFHLLKNFPQFVMIHPIKGFNIVNEAEVDVFLEFPCFFYDPMNVGNLISVLCFFLNPACTSGNGPRYCHTEWSKSDREGEKLHDIPYMQNLERNGINEFIYKTDSQTYRMNLWLPGGRNGEKE